ncbi:type I 3-dehydroquinate dehydratase [Candidatus Micrarchaeota archaeon]|nr:type I 3-dehydroquinate dehydratase [Candidatus Micrarchaeota archaeon]
MICVSIANKEDLKVLKSLELAEIRMDKMDLNDGEIKELFSMPVKLIATCRGNSKELLKAIHAGAAFIDIELGEDKEIITAARKQGCKVIVSHHDFNGTPKREELESIVEKCFEAKADIAKIACKINSEEDNARLLGLLDSEKEIIVVGMGGKGKITRIIAPLIGSPFTFAALEKGKETAEGQMTLDEMKKIYNIMVGQND